MQSIIIICGATASGKSASALDIAQNANGVIINADAMQVYRELHVLTARPTPEQESAAPHLLYGTISVREKCSAARWLEMAREAIDKTLTQKKLPLVTGGTGLYIKTLMEGLSPIPDVPETCHAQAEALWHECGALALQERDPEMHARLKQGDMQRHIRALGVWLATGKSLAYWQSVPREQPYPDATFEITHVTLAREELYRRCDARFLDMMQHGALEEAKQLHTMQLSPDMPATRAVGVRELLTYLNGDCTLEEAVQQAQQATRNYAKRQMTWFRHQL